MKFITKTAITVASIALLACGGGTDTQNDNLTEPWKSLDLPAGSSEIVVVDQEKVLFSFSESSDLTTVTTNFQNALQDAGYKQTEDLTEGDLRVYIYKKAKDEVGLLTTDKDVDWEGKELGLVVYLEDLGKVKDSAVRGKRRPGAKKKARGGKSGGGSKAGKGGGSDGGKSGKGGKGGGGKGGKGKN